MAHCKDGFRVPGFPAASDLLSSLLDDITATCPGITNHTPIPNLELLNLNYTHLIPPQPHSHIAKYRQTLSAYRAASPG